MSSKDVVLGRIRDALALSEPEPVEVTRRYRVGRVLPVDERYELFADRLRDYKAHVHRHTWAEPAGAIARILGEHGARTVGIPEGLDRSWLRDFDGRVVTDTPDVPAPELESLDGVVTGSAVSCAETGTIEVGVPEALARLVPERPTTLISGPSATSDIELERVEGVHGPRTLVVIVVG